MSGHRWLVLWLDGRRGEVSRELAPHPHLPDAIRWAGNLLSRRAEEGARGFVIVPEEERP